MSSANNSGGLVTGTGFSSQCFPVRSLTSYKRQDDGGAWLVAYRAEQRRRFKAVLCAGDPSVSTETLIRKFKSAETEIIEDEKPRKLDGFYLMKQFHVDDPSDLCTVKISGQELREVNDNDFLLFDNVVHVDAGDNSLPFAAFNKFSALQELELPLNNICNTVRVEPDMFVHLVTLDLSYNRLTGDDILGLGLLCSLRTLHLTGNEIKELPIEMTRTYRTVIGTTLSGTVESQEKRLRFAALENLYLDHNELTDLSTFASLAGLRKLKYLNLEHNEISSVPYLRLLGARIRQEDSSRQRNQARNDELGDRNNSAHDSREEKQIEEDSAPLSEENSKSDKGKEKEDFDLDEVDEILNRKLVGEETEGEQRRPEMKPRSSTLTEDPSLLGDRYNPPMPFPTLLHLNLANNLIFEEEGLLALMSWPYLRELVIWGNPLTTAFKGDPPILSVQLGKLKGVQIFRQKPPKRPKPTMNIASMHRKVNDSLPPMPKKQHLAMLEGPPKQKAVAYVGAPYKTLPPIGSAPPTPRHHESAPPRRLSTAPGKTETTPRSKHLTHASSRARSSPPEDAQHQTGHTTRQTVRTEGDVTMAESVQTADSRQQPSVDTQLKSDDGFFMTQGEDLEGGQEGEPAKNTSTNLKERETRDRPFSVETRYKGYEDLLDVDEDDPEIIVPNDIQGSVRALKYALEHTLVFSEPQVKYKERKVKHTKSVSTSTGHKSRQSKVEELGSILDKMRVQSKTKESNLETALQDLKKDPKLRKEYHEAKKLLNEMSGSPNLRSIDSFLDCLLQENELTKMIIARKSCGIETVIGDYVTTTKGVQTKYNEVRVASLRPSVTAREMFGSQSEDRSGPKEEPGEEEANADEKTFAQEKNIAKELKRFKQNIDSRL